MKKEIKKKILKKIGMISSDTFDNLVDICYETFKEIEKQTYKQGMEDERARIREKMEEIPELKEPCGCIQGYRMNQFGEEYVCPDCDGFQWVLRKDIIKLLTNKQ